MWAPFPGVVPIAAGRSCDPDGPRREYPTQGELRSSRGGCRAEAIDQGDPDDLMLAEGKNGVAQVADMGPPTIDHAGRDALLRNDSERLNRPTKEHGLRAATISATPPRRAPERAGFLKHDSETPPYLS